MKRKFALTRVASCLAAVSLANLSFAQPPPGGPGGPGNQGEAPRGRGQAPGGQPPTAPQGRGQAPGQGQAAPAAPSAPAAPQRPSGPPTQQRPSGPTTTQRPGGPTAPQRPGGPSATIQGPGGLGITIRPGPQFDPGPGPEPRPPIPAPRPRRDPLTLIIPPHPPEPVAPRVVYSTRETTSDSIVGLVQRKLKKLGYYTDKVDGEIGANTRTAIRAYQEENNLEVTGRVDKELLRSLEL